MVAFFHAVSQLYVHMFVLLTAVLLNSDLSSFQNSVDSDQLASEEAS